MSIFFFLFYLTTYFESDLNFSLLNCLPLAQHFDLCAGMCLREIVLVMSRYVTLIISEHFQEMTAADYQNY